MTEQFEVSGMYEFRQGDELVARYHPGFAYRITDRNKWFVFNLMDKGGAHKVDAARLAELDAKNGIRLSSGMGRVRGTLEVA